MYQRGGSTFTTGVAPILPPDAYFFSIRAAGSQIGVSSITIDTLSDGVQITERIGLDLPLHPTSSRSQYTSQYTIGTDLRLRDFRITFPGRTAPVVQQGTIEGDSILTVAPGTGEPRWRLDIRNTSLIPPLAAPVALARQQKLKTGERLEVPVFDPLTLNSEVISLAVLDDSTFLVPDSADFDSLGGGWVPAHSDTLLGWKLNWSNGRDTVLMWVDSRGLPIQLISPAGLSLDRSAFEIVTINYRHRRGSGSPPRAGGVIPRTAIAAGVEPQGGVTSMQVRLSTERRPGDIILVPQVSLGPAGDDSIPDSALANWLRDTPHLGTRDSTIRHRAQAIVGDERAPRQVATQLANWVSRNIGRVTDPTVPRAATVLRERQADVDGHTLLFVALARASGLPTRPVSGILLAEGKFYLHSWAEVYLGGWVPVDPTWGEVPAAANRVRMAIGTLARPMDLLPLVAGVDAELISLNQRP